MTEYRLKDLARINSRALAEATDPDFRFRYIDIGSVDERGRVILPEQEMRFAEAPSRARRLAVPGSTVVSTVRTYLRAIASVPKTDDSLVFSTGFAVLEPAPSVDPRFLFYWCRAEPFVQEVVARSVGVGYPAINSNELGDFKIQLPSLEEQRRIADFLGAETVRLDRIEDARRRSRGLLAEHQRTAVDVLVRGADTADPVQAEFAPLQEVPAHWRQTRLRIFPCDVQTGPFGSQLHARDYINDGWPVVNPANIGPYGLVANNSMTVDDATRRRLSEHTLARGDVVFGRRGELGRAAIVTNEEEGWVCGTGTLRVRFRQHSFSPEYLRRYLSIPAVRHYFEARSVGSTMANLNSSMLLVMPLLVPPLEEQEQIAKRCQEVESIARAVEESLTGQLDLFAERRRALITAAVTGAMDVTTARGVG